MRLAVFTGGCTYEAAEEVCAADVDTLQSLIDKSLVRSREATGGARYWMLDTIREFAAAELEASGEPDDLRQRHADYFTALAERADPYLRHGPDQQQWGERVAADYDNVRAAMSFALEQDLTLALRLVGQLGFFLWLRGGFAEAKAWVDAILPCAAGQPLGLLGGAHVCAALIAERIGDIAGQARHSDEAYAAFAAVGDEHGMADALRERGKTASASEDTVRANAIYAELAELAERIGDRWNGAIALNNIGSTAMQAGDWERVIELCGRSSVLRRELGDEWGMALALSNVAFAEVQLGRLSSAARSVRVALDTSMKVDAKTVVTACLDVSAALAAARGKMQEAALVAGAAWRLEKELGSVRQAFDQRVFDQVVESIRASLGADADAEIQRGRELSLEEASAIALAATGDLD